MLDEVAMSDVLAGCREDRFDANDLPALVPISQTSTPGI
jgi:hypothetical protein